MRVKTPIGEMWLAEGLLCHRIDEIVVSEEAAADVQQAIQDLTGGRPTPAVVDIRAIGYAGPKARDMFAALPDDSGEIATALVVGSSASRLMASLFMKFSQPNRPVKVFTNFDEAIEWARSFRAVTD